MFAIKHENPVTVPELRRINCSMFVIPALKCPRQIISQTHWPFSLADSVGLGQ